MYALFAKLFIPGQILMILMNQIKPRHWFSYGLGQNKDWKFWSRRLGSMKPVPLGTEKNVLGLGRFDMPGKD